MNEVWPRIRAARKKLGLTQADFAALLTVTRTAVANWETGQSLPDMANLIRIAEVADVGFEWLATGRGAEQLPSTSVGEQPRPKYSVGQDAWAKNPQEIQLLSRFRLLSAEQRKALLVLLAHPRDKEGQADA